MEENNPPHEYPPYIDEEEGKTAYINMMEETIVGLKIELEGMEEDIEVLEEELSLKDEEIARLNKELKAAKQVKPTKSNSENVSRETIAQTFEATYYGMDCNGCSGITASGLNVSGKTTYNGMKIIAVDKNVIPLHSIVEITHNGSTYKAIAKDTGGAIKGNRIDILVGSEAESFKYGRHKVELKVIERGNNKYIRE